MSRSSGPGGGKRAPVGERRRQRSARALSTNPTMKRHMDAMNARSIERFGLGVGVLVQEGHRHAEIASSLERERRAIVGWRRVLGVAGWPWSRWHRLRREERREQAMAQEWDRRLALVADDVARANMGALRQSNAARGVARGAGER